MSMEILKACDVEGCSNVFPEGTPSNQLFVRENAKDPGRVVRVCNSCYKRIREADEPAYFKPEKPIQGAIDEP